MADVIRLIVDYADWLYALCGLGILVYLRLIFLARRDRKAALFTLEREIASSRATRSFIGMVMFVGLASGIFFITERIAPRLSATLQEDDQTAIQTVFLLTPTSEIPTLTPVPPTLTPLPTPSATRVILLSPTPMPTATVLRIAACSPIAQITSPAIGATLSGQVLIFGTAAAPDFKFYKVEYQREGEPENAWHSISNIHQTQVRNDLLDVWNVSGFSAGNYRIKLTVVDVTGNYPPQNICEVPVRLAP